MSEREVTFCVVHPPVTQGSMCVGRGGHMYHQNDKKLKAYRTALAKKADEYHDIIYSTNGDMGFEVTIVFYLERPKSVKRPLPTRKFDVDKLTRAVLDALTSNERYKIKGLWPDDCQVIRIKSTKYYTDDEHPEPCTIVTVRRVLRPKAFAVDESADSLDEDI